MKRTRIILLSSLVGVSLIGGVGYLGYASSKPETANVPDAPETVTVGTCDVSQTVTAPGLVVATNKTTVQMPFAGTLEQLLVRAGDRVRAGDPLATLPEDEVRLAIAQAQSNVAAAQKAYDKAKDFRTGLTVPRAVGKNYDNARTQYEQAVEFLNYAQQAYDDAHDPYTLDQLNAAKRDKNAAYINLNWFLSGPTDEEIFAADADLALKEAQLLQAQNTLANLQTQFVTDDGISNVIKAPFDGVVTEVSAQANASLSAGAALLTLFAPTDLEVRITILEEDYPYVQPGQSAELFFDALPEQKVTGKVDRVVPVRVQGDRAMYYAYLSIDDIPEALVEGMTADSAIQIAGKEDVLCLPRALVHASSGSQAVLDVWNGVTTEERQVEIGLRGDMSVEILSGLQAGEQVVSQ